MNDLFTNFNETNLKLQSNHLTLIKTESVISALFPNLSKLQSRDKDLLAYCQNLTALHADLNQRFEGIPHLDIPDWQLNPFARGQTQIPNTDESTLLHEQLIEMRNLTNV